MLSPCYEYICSPTYEKGCDEYLNATILHKRLKEEIERCKKPCREDSRREMEAKVRAYELVQAIMVGIWNEGDRLYIKEKYPEGHRNEKSHRSV